MTKLIYILSSFIKCLLVLWVPILLIEETFLFDFIGSAGALICSLFASVLCLILYIKTYKKAKQERINCYIYNIINAMLLEIINLILGYLFLYFIDLNLFHQCTGDGWSCFLFGIEYGLIGMEYAILSVIILIIWLIVRLIKFLSTSKKIHKVK